MGLKATKPTKETEGNEEELQFMLPANVSNSIRELSKFPTIKGVEKSLYPRLRRTTLEKITEFQKDVLEQELKRVWLNLFGKWATRKSPVLGIRVVVLEDLDDNLIMCRSRFLDLIVFKGNNNDTEDSVIVVFEMRNSDDAMAQKRSMEGNVSYSEGSADRVWASHMSPFFTKEKVNLFFSCSIRSFELDCK